ncbi:MAG TPA: MFS transporter [Candidatus Binatia bacterium]|nr:MFS transporter [Candidatus Binatia bacterium]
MEDTKVGWGSVFKDGLALYTIMLNLGIGLHAVDVFIVTTVMPSVVRDIGGESYYAWTTMLYMVASIIGAATGAPLKAGLGARRAYCLGALLFLFGSVSCAVSPQMFLLLAARLVQGFGGGVIISLSMALVSELYPERLRKRILGLISSTWGVAALIGPAVGGTFAEWGFWRGAFWINAPIIVGFMLAAWFRLPERRSPPPMSRFPYRRMMLLAVGVLCVGVASNWQSVTVQAALIVAAVLLVWQTLRLDAAGASKLFPSHPFSPKTTTGSASWVFFLSSMTHTVIGVFLPLALQVLHGVDPLVAGYMTASLAVCWTLASMATAHLHGRAASAAIVIGQVMCCIGLGSLALGIDKVPTYVVPMLNGLVGLGLGCSNLHVTAATMRHAKEGEETLTASSIPTIRSLGIAFGAAGAGLIANGAGLTLLADDIARAVVAVFEIGVLAPFFALVFALRFVTLTARPAANPDAVSSSPAKTAPDSAGAIH